jgi:hypothetical protein
MNRPRPVDVASRVRRGLEASTHCAVFFAHSRCFVVIFFEARPARPPSKTGRTTILWAVTVLSPLSPF